MERNSYPFNQKENKMKTSAGTEIPETNQHCDCGLTGGCEKCNPMFKADLYIEAWYLRTLECIDMDNGDRIIPPPTKSEWKFGVKKDLESLLTQQRTELLEEIKKIIDKLIYACSVYTYNSACHCQKLNQPPSR